MILIFFNLLSVYTRILNNGCMLYVFYILGIQKHTVKQDNLFLVVRVYAFLFSIVISPMQTSRAYEIYFSECLY